MRIVDTLCRECEEKEYRYEYHFPHPAKWYWFCKALKVKLTQHSGVRRDWRCPKLNRTDELLGGNEVESDIEL